MFGVPQVGLKYHQVKAPDLYVWLGLLTDGSDDKIFGDHAAN